MAQASGVAIGDVMIVAKRKNASAFDLTFGNVAATHLPDRVKGVDLMQLANAVTVDTPYMLDIPESERDNLQEMFKVVKYNFKSV